MSSVTNRLTGRDTLHLALRLTCGARAWPIAGTFAISRGAKTQAEVVVVGTERRNSPRPGRMRALCAVRRDRRRRRRRHRGDGARVRERARPRGAAKRDAGRRRAQRARLRAVGSRSQARGQRAYRTCRASPRRSRWSRPTRFPSARPMRWRRRRTTRRASSAAQDQARRGRRSGSASPRCAAPRRMRNSSPTPTKDGRRKTSTRTCAPAPPPASRWWSSRCPPTNDAALASIARAIPVCADESVHDRASLQVARRKIRRGQHQARQDRRTDRSAGDGGRRARAEFLDHGRLHGVHVARRSRRRCWWRRARAWSISTGRCCWRRIARTACATTAARSIRQMPCLWG